MKTYRQREKQGTKVSDTNKGPDEAKIKVRTKLAFKNDVETDICMLGTTCVKVDAVLLSKNISSLTKMLLLHLTFWGPFFLPLQSVL